MNNTFSSDFFSGNRKRLRSLFQGTAPIILTANGLLQQSTDSTYPFKQDGNFWYLTGINEPDLILVMDKDKEYIILPDQSDYQKNFNGAYDSKEISQMSGIIEILDQKNGWKKLTSRLKKAKHFATLAPSPAYIDVIGFYTNPARKNLVAKINEINAKIELLDLRKQFSVMRMVKQPQELTAIQRAIDITILTLNKIKTNIELYKNEYQIEADLTFSFRNLGSNGHAFDPIVAGGSNACIVHYMKNNQSIHTNDLVLLDVGADVNGYAADISRTYSRGAITKRQKQIQSAVCDVQDYAFSVLKPGVLLREYEQQVRNYMGEKLRVLGLIKTIDDTEIEKYFPHKTSHFLGFDVHDLGDYDRPLEPGVVITVEPGIYINDEGIGVRIEDDVVVTERGIKIMTQSLSRDL